VSEALCWGMRVGGVEGPQEEVVVSDMPHVAGGASPVLDENEAIELLAYLVTAARTQVSGRVRPAAPADGRPAPGSAIAARASESTARFVTSSPIASSQSTMRRLNPFIRAAL
jgi:hypothetical protein